MQTASEVVYVCSIYLYHELVLEDLGLLFWCAILSINWNTIYASTGIVDYIITCTVDDAAVIGPNKLIFTPALEIRPVLVAHCGDLDVGEVD